MKNSDYILYKVMNIFLSRVTFNSIMIVMVLDNNHFSNNNNNNDNFRQCGQKLQDTEDFISLLQQLKT